jgi:hypothetical protein
MENKKQRIELGEIFAGHADDFLHHYKLVPAQAKAFQDIIKCRTAALGGHVYQCDKCGNSRQAYNSCRNRHCPKCQFVRKAVWVDKLAANLPPVKHFHIVFTIPDCLHKLFYHNQKPAYDALFNAAGQALAKCASNPAFLGAQAGAVAILHTWGQALTYHPHIHMMVPGGGLSQDQMEWVPAHKKFFLPVKVLSKVFRAILCRLLEESIATGNIRLPDDNSTFSAIKHKAYSKDWVVYCEKPFAGPNALLNYLGNYTHRVAIANSRIQSFADGKVSFSYKDYRADTRHKTMTLDATEFIRRFLQHVLPSGFCKVRYFGFLAICNMKTKLADCIRLIGKTTFLPQLQGLNAMELWWHISGIDPMICQKCKKGRMLARPIPGVLLLKPG